MSTRQRSASTSSRPDDSSDSPNKSSKTQHGQSASSSVRLRRAARACDRCRASKLRCQAPNPSTGERRCAHCLKMDLECQYTNPPPPHAVPTTEASGSSVTQGEGNERLSKLEANVAKLLEMMEKKMDRGNAEQWGDGVSPAIQPLQAAATSLRSPTVPQPYHQQRSTLEALSQLAAADDPLPVANTADFDSWLPPSASAAGPSRDTGSNFVFDSLVTIATGDMGHQHHFASPPDAAAGPGIESIATVLSVSPNAVSDTRKTPRSGNDPNPSSTDDHYGSAQARPIPKAGAGSRVAAFTEPSSHEAPFRPLTYNPDTFRNAEMAGPSRGEAIDGAYRDEGGWTSGGKTPKRGRGDPIDRGVFTEEEARALFDFFQEEISFLMPIFQEPMTFDFVRHQSSFLLSTILAVAAKYTCVSTMPQASGDEHPGDLFRFNSSASMDSLKRHAVQPVAEEQWFQIRALAMSSYFQALISKVHCLEDVQAILLMCAWGLEDRGASPDPWMLTGSAFRLARRLGIHLAAGAVVSGTTEPTARVVASWKTYLCLYAFDRFFTVGFGRPETEGFDESTLDTSLLLSFLGSDNSSSLGLVCSPDSAACVVAYVELANMAKRYSRFVNVLLKTEPSSFLGAMRDISGDLDAFSSRWLWARSPLAAKLGRAQRPIKMLYNHIRLCLHSVPLKPITHPDSEVFLQRTGLQGPSGSDILSMCLKKAEDSATRIIQDFADDSREDNDSILCYGFDYAFLILAHSAAVLLSLSTIHVCGTASPATYVDDTHSTGSQPGGGVDRSAAIRYYGMAINAMVESNRSANFFPYDIADNLSLIAQEMGISVPEWTSNCQGCRTGRRHQCSFERRSQRPDTGVDFSLFPDIDQFLQPGFFEDGGLFSNTLLM